MPPDNDEDDAEGFAELAKAADAHMVPIDDTLVIQQLKTEFGIQEFPVLVLLDSDGQVFK